MVKFIYFIVVLVAAGCQWNTNKKTYRDFQAQGYGLVLGSGFLDVQFNLENDSLNASLSSLDFKYRDTMHLSESEQDEIAASFFEQNIDECHGDIEVNGKNFSYPIVSNEIYIYRQKRQIAAISIVKSYEQDGLFPDTREKKIVKFRNDVWKILNGKTKYQIATDSLRSVLRKSDYIFL